MPATEKIIPVDFQLNLGKLNRECKKDKYIARKESFDVSQPTYRLFGMKSLPQD